MIEKSKIYFEYEEIKRGKRVNELLFIIKDNPAFKQEKPQLFQPEQNKFEEFIGKILPTKNGDKKIILVEDLGDFLKVYFEGGHSQIKNIEILKKVTK